MQKGAEESALDAGFDVMAQGAVGVTDPRYARGDVERCVEGRAVRVGDDDTCSACHQQAEEVVGVRATQRHAVCCDGVCCGWRDGIADQRP